MDMKDKLPSEKIPKGYRLEISTHQLIHKIKIMLHVNQDTVLTMACEELYKKLSLRNKSKLNSGNKINNKKVLFVN